MERYEKAVLRARAIAKLPFNVWLNGKEYRVFITKSGVELINRHGCDNKYLFEGADLIAAIEKALEFIESIRSMSYRGEE